MLRRSAQIAAILATVALLRDPSNPSPSKGLPIFPLAPYPVMLPGFAGVSPWGGAAQKESFMRTYTPKANEIERQWHIVDAEGMVLGRLCTEVARILRGKHKPTFAPHMDTGDHVIVINASKVVLTSGKADKNMVYTYSGYPGGLKSETYGELLSRKPDDAIRRSVAGMLPKGPLGRQMVKKLKVYAGPEHPHAAQSPVVLSIPGAKR